MIFTIISVPTLLFVDNEVTKFKGDEASYSGTTMIKEGYGINTQYIYIADRIVQTQADLDYVQSLVDNPKLDEEGKPINYFKNF